MNEATRYDYKTANKLFLAMGNLGSRYDGTITRLHNEASCPADLEKKLKQLGKGKGDVTVGIFLRELRGLWSEADPKPTPLVIAVANAIGIAGSETPEEAL